MKKVFLISGLGIAIGLILAGEIIAQEPFKEVTLTIYNQNLALVKDRRMMIFKEGLNQITMEDVSTLIDPTSVHFKSLTAADGCLVREQHYEYDLLGGDKLLQKYIDRKIRVQTKDGKIYEGSLLSFDADQIILGMGKQAGPINLIYRQDNIQTLLFPALPDGLITRPTLVWEIIPQKAGRQTVEVSYLTEGINWSVDYVAVVNDNEIKLDLSGWVSIDNQSGTVYRDAELKLVAGEVPPTKDEVAPSGYAREFKSAPVYSLPRRVTLENKQIKQITLLSAAEISVKKLYVFDVSNPYGWVVSGRKKKINVKLELENKKEVGLGIPLPKGKIRVYKADQEGKLQFVGEDLIDHTPVDEKIRLYAGDTFDIIGERQHIKTERVNKRIQDDSYEIKLRSHRENDVEITVIEHFPKGREWKIMQTSHDFTKKDAYTIEFKVDVDKDRETVISYTVRTK